MARTPTSTTRDAQFDEDFGYVEFENNRKSLAHRRSVQNVKEEDRGLTVKPYGNLPGNFENIRASNTLKSDKKKRTSKKIKSPTSVESIAKIMESEVSEPLSPTDTTVSIAEVPVPDTSFDSFETNPNVEQVVPQPQSLWIAQPPLRNHYDAVRSVAFHPTDLALFTGSEDHTIKLWRLSLAFDPTLDQEPKLTYTFRGHTAPVTTVAVSPIEDLVFSGSMDSTIRIFNIPPLNLPTHSPHDRTIAVHTLVGHSDAIWEVSPHLVAPLLLSASADGSLKLWDVQNPGLKTTYWYGGGIKGSASSFESPTSICWSTTSSLIASYRNSVVKSFDMETRAVNVQFESNDTFGSRKLTRPIFQNSNQQGHFSFVPFINYHCP
jgi:WD40 repeat protein